MHASLAAMPEPSSTDAIEHALGAALARRGAHGRVVVREQTAEFHGSGPVVSIDIAELVQQWSLLPDDMRDGKVQHAVERLRSAIANALPPPVETTDMSPIVGKILGAVILIVTVVGSGAWLARARVSRGGAGQTASAGASATGAAPVVDVRGRESCEATRRRLSAGATSFDVDPAGWVIELWLARDANPRPLSSEPVLGEATDAALLSRLGAVAPASASWVDTGEPDRARLRFEGGYLHPFMHADGRDRFVALVDQLAEATLADHAALFARCAHSNVRDIGAYFRGRNAGGAAASLLFAQGLFSEPPVVDKAKLGSESNALAALQRLSAGLELSVLEELIRDNGGRVTAVDASSGRGSVGLSFALGGPTRAQQAARALARLRKVH